MTANDSKPYLPYLNKLVDQYNNTYHHSINKEPIDADYSGLTESFLTNSKPPKFKVNNRVRITKYKNIFGKSLGPLKKDVRGGGGNWYPKLVTKSDIKGKGYMQIVKPPPKKLG